MLVLLKATVTTSAPDSLIASPVSFKSLYFPVPTNNLEEKEYEPIFNRALIFYTGKNSYHGHPQKLATPLNVFRKSIALYYYIDKKTHLKLEETNFVPLPKDNFFTKFLIKFDQLLLRIFSFLKRKKIVNDKTYTKIIKNITKK